MIRASGVKLASSIGKSAIVATPEDSAGASPRKTGVAGRAAEAFALLASPATAVAEAELPGSPFEDR
ncbi:MAG TPA: hypothetical protein VHW45_04995 [Candidatus Sulfotelmatobacter sp.]|nr:hypothetical protein [Candidatus Sulfotelmatobacter sp.]